MTLSLSFHHCQVYFICYHYCVHWSLLWCRQPGCYEQSLALTWRLCRGMTQRPMWVGCASVRLTPSGRTFSRPWGWHTWVIHTYSSSLFSCGWNPGTFVAFPCIFSLFPHILKSPFSALSLSWGFRVSHSLLLSQLLCMHLFLSNNL